MTERSEEARGDATSGGVPGFGERGMNRRDFLKLAGAGLAGASLLGVAGCGGGGGQGGGGEFTFSFGPDPSGSLQQLVDMFNQQFEGQYRANYREMPADTGAYFDQIRTEFQGGGEIDLIGDDVIWPAQLAAPGYIADLQHVPLRRRHPACDRRDPELRRGLHGRLRGSGRRRDGDDTAGDTRPALPAQDRLRPHRRRRQGLERRHHWAR